MTTQTRHKGDGHRKRLRDRFLEYGLSGFQDYEVIELLLTLGTPRKDCKDTAKALIKRFKTLTGVFEASPAELAETDGVGQTNQLGIRLIRDVAERYLETGLRDKDAIHCSDDLLRYLNMAIRDKRKECFVAVFLNAKNRVITTTVLSSGTLTASSVYPREVVQAALDHRAAAMIFAHNHPSGDPGPSKEDIAVTRKLVFACRVMGITVHEHLIIGGNDHYSFADNGYIQQFNREFNNQESRIG